MKNFYFNIIRMYVYIRISTYVTHTDNISKLIYFENRKFQTTNKELFLDSANTYRSNTLTHWKNIVNELYQ